MTISFSNFSIWNIINENSNYLPEIFNNGCSYSLPCNKQNWSNVFFKCYNNDNNYINYNNFFDIYGTSKINKFLKLIKVIPILIFVVKLIKKW